MGQPCLYVCPFFSRSETPTPPQCLIGAGFVIVFAFEGVGWGESGTTAKRCPGTKGGMRGVTRASPPPKEPWAIARVHKTQSAQSAERNLARQWPIRP